MRFELRMSVDEPHDRLTQLCDVAASAAEASPVWREGDRIIVLVSSEEEGGMTFQGYVAEETAEAEDAAASGAAADMVMHLRALLRAHGRELSVFPMPGRG